MTQNLYLGANIRRVLKARSIDDIATQVERIVEQVEETDFVARAYALAAVVEKERPDVLSLQEVALWRRDREGSIIMSCRDAREVRFDFLAILQNAFANFGLDYEVAAVGTNEDAEAPTQTLGEWRLTDRNALLVRRGIEVLSTDSDAFDSQRSWGFLGLGISMRRGWVSAVLSKEGRVFHVINPHMDLVDPERREQVEEALDFFDGTTPTIFAGDFNTNPEISRAMRNQMKALGLRDAGLGGLNTCCQPKSLTNHSSRLGWRPDLVLYSERFERISAKRVGASSATRARAGKRRLWISDHAGVSARLRLGRPES